MGSRRLVALHGFLGNEHSFRSVLARLDLDEPPLCPALSGHGASVALRPTYDFNDEVCRLATLIEHHFGGCPVHIAGYSLGARLSLALLARAPGLFHSATLVSGRSGLDSARECAERLAADQRWASLLKDDFNRFLTAWAQQPIFASMAHWPPEAREDLRTQRATGDPVALAQALTSLSLAKMPNLRDALARVKVPVTVLAGQLDPKFVALGRDLASGLPKGKFVVVDGAGHPLLIERPDAVAAAIREGLDHAPRNLESGSDL